jgi:cellulose biosynthesis protein BcsQ
MRAFPDPERRDRMRDEFYVGKLWKEQLEEKLMPILEKYDVVIVDAPNGLGEWR